MLTIPICVAVLANLYPQPQGPSAPRQKLDKSQALALLKEIVIEYETRPRSGPRDLPAVKAAIQFADLQDARTLFGALREYHGWLSRTYPEDAVSLDPAVTGLIFGLRYQWIEKFPEPLHFDTDGYLRLPPYEGTFTGLRYDFVGMLRDADRHHGARRDLSEFRSAIAKEEQRFKGSAARDLSLAGDSTRPTYVSSG